MFWIKAEPKRLIETDLISLLWQGFQPQIETGNSKFGGKLALIDVPWHILRLNGGVRNKIETGILRPAPGLFVVFLIVHSSVATMSSVSKLPCLEFGG